jgi:hypothetical protein
MVLLVITVSVFVCAVVIITTEFCGRLPTGVRVDTFCSLNLDVGDFVFIHYSEVES